MESFSEREDAFAQLDDALLTVKNARLISWRLSNNGGVAVLYFDNGASVSLGASGNLWDEAYPHFAKGETE